MTMRGRRTTVCGGGVGMNRVEKEKKKTKIERKIRAKRPAAANERVRAGRRRANDDGNQTLTPVYAVLFL